MDKPTRKRIEIQEWLRRQKAGVAKPVKRVPQDEPVQYVEPPDVLKEYGDALQAYGDAVEAAAKPKQQPEARRPGRPKKEPAPRTSPYTPMAVFEVGLPSRSEEPEPEPTVWPDEKQLKRKQLEEEAELGHYQREKERADREGRVMPGTTAEAEALERLDELREEDEAGLAYGHPDFPGSHVPYYRRGASDAMIQRRRGALANFTRYGGRGPRRGAGTLAVGYQGPGVKAGG